MKKQITLSLVLLLCLTSMSQIIENIYDFNGLTSGDLNGQDDWATVANISPAGDMQVAYFAGNIVSPDGTLAAFWDFGGPNVGRTASRQSSDNLPFDFSVGGIVEIEVETYTGWWGTYFAIGYDYNNNGYIIPGVETVVNCEDNEGGIGFYIANQSTDLLYFILPDGSKVQYSMPGNLTANGWHDFKILVDMDANGGQGSVSMSIREMEGDWISVAEIQNLNMGLTPGSGTSTDPANLTKLMMHGQGESSGFDNITIRQPDPNAGLYQYITFEDLPDKLITAVPFEVSAYTNQGLEVGFTVTSGPATIEGNIVTLEGIAGFVTITASQAGNDTVAPAEDILRTFEVVDATTIWPELDIRNPIQGAIVQSPNLDAIQVSIATNVDYSHIISVNNAEFEVNGEIITATPTHNGFFVGYWTPPGIGTYTLIATATHSEGVSSSETITFEVGADGSTVAIDVIDHVHWAVDGGDYADTTLILPSFTGTYSSIKAVLTYDCPTGGCEPWDLVSSCNIRGANGEFIELFKYITPYGVDCSDEVDITDFASQIQGKVDFSVDFPGMSIITITFIYEEGTPVHKYSWMEKIWLDVYKFGDMANLQPVEVMNYEFPSNTSSAHLRLMCSGHGWGENNTENAAEFYEATHNIRIDGSTAFTQHLWETCNPNPVGCQPQNGTWYYNRAGWCPGSIPMLWQFDLTPYISNSSIEVMYEFEPDYADLCSAANPDCESGVTCPDCNDTYNPQILVAGEMVNFSNDVIIITPVNDSKFEAGKPGLDIYPNPSNGMFQISTTEKMTTNNTIIRIINISGEVVYEFSWDGKPKEINLTEVQAGMYFVKVINYNGIEVNRIILF